MDLVLDISIVLTMSAINTLIVQGKKSREKDKALVTKYLQGSR